MFVGNKRYFNGNEMCIMGHAVDYELGLCFVKIKNVDLVFPTE